VRSALQKHLKGVMGTTGATFVRFGFGVPFSLAFVYILNRFAGYPIPAANTRFLIWTLVGGLTQIFATALLIHLFSFRNFAVGTAYSRTEPAQAAVFGLLFLGETVTPGAVTAIAISVVGVMLISVAHSGGGWRALLSSVVSRNALIGLASGTLFGIAAVAYRAASLALDGPNFMMQAAVTLAYVIIFQTVIMFVGWPGRSRPRSAVSARLEAGADRRSIRRVGLVRLFMAMTLQQAAIVKSLAQIEMLFTMASSVFFFRERINRLEAAGCLLIVAGIVALIFLR